MNFTAFRAALEVLEESIVITNPVSAKVKRAYWGATSEAMSDLPCVINAWTESERTLGFGGREQKGRVNVQLLVAKAMAENTRSALIATAFWFATKDIFDKNTNIGGTISWSTIRGGEPTVPVILTHAGQAYIGFNAYLDIQSVGEFDFE